MQHIETCGKFKLIVSEPYPLATIEIHDQDVDGYDFISVASYVNSYGKTEYWSYFIRRDQ